MVLPLQASSTSGITNHIPKLSARDSVNHSASRTNQITSGAITNPKMSRHAICQIHMPTDYHQRIEVPPLCRLETISVNVKLSWELKKSRFIIVSASS